MSEILQNVSSLHGDKENLDLKSCVCLSFSPVCTVLCASGASQPPVSVISIAFFFVTAGSAGAKDEDRQLVQLLKEEEVHISRKIVALREEVGKWS